MHRDSFREKKTQPCSEYFWVCPENNGERGNIVKKSPKPVLGGPIVPVQSNEHKSGIITSFDGSF